MPNPNRPWILAALMLFMMMAAMDVTIVSTAVPQIVTALGDFSLFTWVFSIYLLTQTVTIPIYGKLADIYGRKPILLGGGLLFLLGSAACAAAWNMPSLIAFRGLQGLGAGAIMATVNTLAGDLYSLEERGRVQGFLSSVWGMAAISGPMLGGAFVEYVSWHWIFLVNLPIGALAVAVLWVFLHEPQTHKRRQIDYLGSVTILAGVGTLIFALMQGGTAWPWLSVTSIGVFMLAALLLMLAVWTQRRAADPVMPGWLWRNRGLACANLSMIGMGFIVMVPSAYLPTFAQSVFQVNAITAGLVLAAMSIGWPLASSFSARLYLRIGFRNTAVIGSLLVCVATGSFLLLSYQVSIWVIVAGQIVLGAGFGLLSTPMLVGAQSSVDWHQRGVVTGANMFSRFLGQSLGVAVFGTLFNAGLSQRLQEAPAQLREQLPQEVDTVVSSLQQAPLTDEVALYLRHMIFDATQGLYIGLFVIAVIILAIVLLSPRHFSHQPSVSTAWNKQSTPS
ncbi:MFS transporter [Oceanisphaera marina]|uniref:MFS transporter n=1 Tax=Oceanisphaera marina TaxID=2017550 RepID=A0ABQ1IZR3_9GAMM|nr:MDR family MFS transporter [Oceanisphaera marina]GGB54501.1 MFS transporter [Oceanisphaera marina]